MRWLDVLERSEGHRQGWRGKTSHCTAGGLRVPCAMSAVVALVGNVNALVRIPATPAAAAAERAEVQHRPQQRSEGSDNERRRRCAHLQS